MIKAGISFLLGAIILWTVFLLTIFFSQSEPNGGIITASITLGIIGSLLLLVGVGIDRYHEYKKDERDNDYRKY